MKSSLYIGSHRVYAIPITELYRIHVIHEIPTPY